jgi:hypothetical protein
MQASLELRHRAHYYDGRPNSAPCFAVSDISLLRKTSAMKWNTVTTTLESPATAAQASGTSRRTLAIVGVSAVLLGGVAGFGASALHPGSDGKTGATGKAGITGTTGKAGVQGAVGPTGTAAAVSDLGVCYNTTSGNFTNGDSYISSVYITSVSKHADGTTFCSTGSYVPVSPGAATSGSN